MLCTLYCHPNTPTILGHHEADILSNCLSYPPHHHHTFVHHLTLGRSKQNLKKPMIIIILIMVWARNFPFCFFFLIFLVSVLNNSFVLSQCCFFACHPERDTLLCDGRRLFVVVVVLMVASLSPLPPTIEWCCNICSLWRTDRGIQKEREREREEC